MINEPLFDGQHIHLSAIDPETDPQVESAWSHDLGYTQPFFPAYCQPRSAHVLKKFYTDQAQKTDQFHFAIRLKEKDKLVGFLRFPFIAWSHQAAQMQLSMADSGLLAPCGAEALNLGVAYAFQELNLFRLDVVAAEYDQSLQNLYEKAGFRQEVRQRSGIYRSGYYWDKIRYGLLREDYLHTPPDTNHLPAPLNPINPAVLPPVVRNSQLQEPFTDVFKGRLTYLQTLEPGRDAELLSNWAHDSEYDRLLSGEPAKMWTVKQVSEWYENRIANEQIFMIYTLADNRPIGNLDLSDIDPQSGDAWVGIGLGERDCWGQGYGTDALEILVRYAFSELNLKRLSLTVFAYNQRAIRSYEKLGFVLEGRARQYIYRSGQRWDMLFMGILREDWL